MRINNKKHKIRPKKIIALILVFTMIFLQIPNLSAFAVVDVTPPTMEVSTLKIDKTEAVVGEKVKISLRATDDESGINYINLNYQSPITKKTISIKMTYNTLEDVYEGYMNIDANTESGIWKIYRIDLYDKNDNYSAVTNSNLITAGNNKDLSGGDFTVSGTVVDVTPPTMEVSTLKVDKTEGTLGDKIKISFRATDDESGMDHVNLYYQSPITKKTINVKMTYNALEDMFEGYMNIDSNTESGIWKIYRIDLYDKLDNYSAITNSNVFIAGNNKDLRAGDFTVSGTVVDVTPPTMHVSTLKVDKTEGTLGDKIKISFRATDDESGMKSVNLYYQSPITKKTIDIKMTYNSLEDIYEGYIDIDENTELGTWKIYRINLYDKTDNHLSILNSNIVVAGNNEDLSGGDFIVKEDTDPAIPIEGVTVVTKNESWTSKTIEGDLYIGPKAVLSVKDVTVKGNVYVLGALKSYGNLTIENGLYGNNMGFSIGSTLYNGTVLISGSNNINSITMTTYPVTDMPVRIDNGPLKSIDGKLDIIGQTLDIADMYIEGNKYEIGYKGKIRISDLNIGNKEKVEIKFKTVFGNEIIKEYPVDNYVTSPSGKLNKLPTINGIDDLTIKVGDTFDPKLGVLADDKENGNITSLISVEGEVNTKEVGEYILTYSVTDYDEGTTTKTRKITVRSNEKPVITGIEDKIIKARTPFNPKADIKASDKEDGDLTEKIIITGEVDTNTVGEYTLTYSITDKDNNTTTATRKITVVSNEKPIILGAEDKTIKVGDIFDLKAGVTATDKEDIDLTEKIVTTGTVNTNTVGEYTLTYSVTDSDNNTTTVTRKITVRSNEKPIIVGVENKTIKAGDTFDPKDGVKVTDKEDGDLILKVIITGEVDTNTVGEYTLTYSVTDKDNNTTTATRKITVRSNEKPSINGVEDLSIKNSSIFDPKHGVTARDKEDGDLTSKIVIIGTVDTSKAGIHKLIYTVTDNDNNTTVKERIITVGINEKPVIIGVKDITIKVGDNFDPRIGITASDAEDGDLTSKIDVFGHVVNTKYPGEYIVEYGVTDSANNYTTVKRKVIVRTNEKPIITTPDEIKIKRGDTFNAKSNLIVLDHEDGDITSKVIVSGSVDTSKLGKYIVTYTVTDSDGNKATKQMTVIVENRNVQVNSLIGSNRYDTSVQLSQSEFGSTDTVVIANGGALADGLAATPLAAYKKAPLLLTANNSLPETTKNEIKRLKAKNAIIIGGSGVVSGNVVAELKALGITKVERIGGTDRYDTSLEIAKYIDKNCYDISNVVLSNGLGQADALSIAAVAGRDKMAIILVKKDEIPDKIYNWLKAESLQNAYIIGGTGVVSTNVLTKVDGITASDVTKNRLGGKDRYGTNAMIIEKFYGNSIKQTYIAKGIELIDALAAGPVAAINGGAVVLTGNDLTAEQKTALNKRIGDKIIRTGGGITDKAVDSLQNCLN